VASDRHNIGPGDSYIGLWRLVSHYRHRLFGVQRSLANGPLTHSRRQELERDERYLTKRIVKIYVIAARKTEIELDRFEGRPAEPAAHGMSLNHWKDELYDRAVIKEREQRPVDPYDPEKDWVIVASIWMLAPPVSVLE
jgi:hypothetical protein